MRKISENLLFSNQRGKVPKIWKVVIKIAGSAHRSFVFPAKLEDAFNYYGDIRQSFRFLPHISVAHNYAAGQYRLLYSALESGVYKVNIFCDVVAVIDENQHIIKIDPLKGNTPEKSKAGLYSMTGQGFFNSEILFNEDRDQTRIEFSIDLKASLPVPLTLRWIPNALIDGISQIKVHWHMDEIIERFIEQSTRAFWQMGQ